MGKSSGTNRASGTSKEVGLEVSVSRECPAQTMCESCERADPGDTKRPQEGGLRKKGGEAWRFRELECNDIDALKACVGCLKKPG